jgi:hypothetical protein
MQSGYELCRSFGRLGITVSSKCVLWVCLNDAMLDTGKPTIVAEGIITVHLYVTNDVGSQEGALISTPWRKKQRHRNQDLPSIRPQSCLMDGGSPDVLLPNEVVPQLRTSVSRGRVEPLVVFFILISWQLLACSLSSRMSLIGIVVQLKILRGKAASQ